MKKYFVLLGLLLLVPVSVQAQVSTSDTTDAVFLKNQGYSDEAGRLIEVRAKEPLAPQTVKEDHTVWSAIYTKFMNTLDPTRDQSQFGEHNIEYKHMTVDDL